MIHLHDNHFRISIIFSLFIILLFSACESTIELPEDLVPISWITEQGFTKDDLYPLKVSGRIPGPRIAVTVNNEKHYCLVNLESLGLFIAEGAYKGIKFELERIVDNYNGVSEMTLEEGYLHNVSLMNNNYDLIYCSLIKRAKFLSGEKGLVGRDFFYNGTMVIDLKNEILAYSERKGLKYPSKNPLAINAESLSDDNEGLPIIQARFHDSQLLVSISTGTYKNRISPEFFQDFSVDRNGSSVKLDSLYIGDILLTDLKCDVFEEQLLLAPESDLPVHLTLGLEFFKNYVVTINFPDHKLFLQ